jgi:hypothetical protein
MVTADRHVKDMLRLFLSPARMPVTFGVLCLFCVWGLLQSRIHGGEWGLIWYRWLGMVLMLLAPTAHLTASRSRAMVLRHSWGFIFFLVGLCLASVEIFTRLASLLFDTFARTL